MGQEQYTKFNRMADDVVKNHTTYFFNTRKWARDFALSVGMNTSTVIDNAVDNPIVDVGDRWQVNVPVDGDFTVNESGNRVNHPKIKIGIFDKIRNKIGGIFN